MNAHSVVVTWALPPGAFLLKRISSQVELLEMGASLNTLTNTVQLCNTHTHTDHCIRRGQHTQHNKTNVSVKHSSAFQKLLVQYLAEM